MLPGDLLHDRVMHRALMPAYVYYVTISFGRYHASARALVLEHRVRRDRRAVIKMADTCSRRGYPVAQFQNALHDPAGRIVDRGRHLVNGRFVVFGIEQNDVGESA